MRSGSSCSWQESHLASRLSYESDHSLGRINAIGCCLPSAGQHQARHVECKAEDVEGGKAGRGLLGIEGREERGVGVLRPKHHIRYFTYLIFHFIFRGSNNLRTLLHTRHVTRYLMQIALGDKCVSSFSQ